MNGKNNSHQVMVHLESGDTLLEQGLRGKGLFVLIRGKLEVVTGETRLATISQKGAFVGEISSILGTACSATVRALVPSDLMHVANVTDYFDKNPQVAYVLAQTLSRRIMDMNTRMAVLERLLMKIAKEHTLGEDVSRNIVKVLGEIHEVSWTGGNE